MPRYKLKSASAVIQAMILAGVDPTTAPSILRGQPGPSTKLAPKVESYIARAEHAIPAADAKRERRRQRNLRNGK